MIKNLLFDMGGVLFDQNEEEAYTRFAKIGVDVDKYLGRFGQKDFFGDLESGAIDDLAFCEKLSQLVGRNVAWGEAQYCWLGFVDGVRKSRLQNLEQLRKMGYHLCLLSNTNPFIMAFMRSSDFSEEERPITDFLDSFFCSFEMKACKPDPSIYLRALEIDGMKPEECLFIDDSMENIETAKSLGMQVLHTETNEDWMPKVMEIINL